jgi:hypothetical protein
MTMWAYPRILDPDLPCRRLHGPQETWRIDSTLAAYRLRDGSLASDTPVHPLQGPGDVWDGTAPPLHLVEVRRGYYPVDPRDAPHTAPAPDDGIHGPATPDEIARRFDGCAAFRLGPPAALGSVLPDAILLVAIWNGDRAAAEAAIAVGADPDGLFHGHYSMVDQVREKARWGEISPAAEADLLSLLRSASARSREQGQGGSP